VLEIAVHRDVQEIEKLLGRWKRPMRARPFLSKS
jgi:hypothetical protein